MNVATGLPDLDDILGRYAEAMSGGLMTCTIVEGLEDLRVQTPEHPGGPFQVATRLS
jgi:hypothetical protein